MKSYLLLLFNSQFQETNHNIQSLTIPLHSAVGWQKELMNGVSGYQHGKKGKEKRGEALSRENEGLREAVDKIACWAYTRSVETQVSPEPIMQTWTGCEVLSLATGNSKLVREEGSIFSRSVAPDKLTTLQQKVTHSRVFE